jgi:hypothetical protein
MATNVTTTHPQVVATVDLTGQTAAIGSTLLYAIPAGQAGMYRVSWVATVTTAATTSCILGGTNGLQLIYTGADDSVVKTSNPTTVTLSAINATGTAISDVWVGYCQAATNLNWSFGYTSVGVTPMSFALHIRAEAL